VRIVNNKKNQAVFNLTSDMIAQVHQQVAVTMQAGSFGIPIAGKKQDNLFVGYCGEIAVAEYLDVPWNRNTYKTGQSKAMLWATRSKQLYAMTANY